MSDSISTSVPPELPIAIRAARHIVLAGHETPDADCIGCCGALWLGLRTLGKDARLVMPGALSRKVEYLVHRTELTIDTAAAALDGCDLAILCDTAKEKRANVPGGFEALRGTPVANIDHHATNTGFGAHTWIDAQRSSTSEMVYELLFALGVSLTVPLATLLYAGIHSDTKGFSLSNTTPRCLEISAALAAAGAPINELCEELDRSMTRGEFMLNQVVYANTRVSACGRIAWSSASYEEIRRSGCSADTIDDQVEIPRSIAGIRIAILFSEGETGVVRMNFRGERGTSVLNLAESFGGGGHHAAAGARRRAALAEVVSEVTSAALAHLDAG